MKILNFCPRLRSREGSKDRTVHTPAAAALRPRSAADSNQILGPGRSPLGGAESDSAGRARSGDGPPNPPSKILPNPVGEEAMILLCRVYSPGDISAPPYDKPYLSDRDVFRVYKVGGRGSSAPFRLLHVIYVISKRGGGPAQAARRQPGAERPP
ncbi:hypothetical protein EVAR_81800_1 [Eumeta japonica]|uniref:Uncharacterized protein n=1 Tax=Eumeta variegata TaxID=151549 RepID=A0A4C1UHM4_EUMVA|nr:hypothetical protein EVAR_81800_1 [Eumeta japonica]